MREYIEIPSSFALTAQPFRDARRHAVARFQHRDLDGALKSVQVGAAMTLDDDPIQSDHARAIVAARINPGAQRLQRRPRGEVAELAQRRAAEFLAQRIRYQA